MRLKIDKISKTYAKSLLLNYPRESLHNLITDIHLCQNILSQTDNLKIILVNPFIKKNIKKSILKSVLTDKVEKKLVHFMLVICDKKRSSLIPNILNKTIELAYEYAGMQHITIESVIPLTQTQKTSLEDKLKILTGEKKIQLQLNINKELMGGLVITTKTTKIDFSIRTKLKNFLNLLIINNIT